MKKILLLAFMGVASLGAAAQTVADYCGEYQWYYRDAWDNPGMQPVKITEGTEPGKVIINGMYKSIGGEITVTADIDLEAKTLSIPFTDLNSYQRGLALCHGYWTSDPEYGNYVNDVDNTPIVGVLKDGGIIAFEDKMEGIVFGDYDEENLDDFGYYAAMREMRFEPAKDMTFQYNADEWDEVGSAIYRDVVFGYKVFGSREPKETLVRVALNKENPKRLLFINPYQTDEWKAVNRDRTGAGFVIADISDPEFVIFEPYVYSGYEYDYRNNNDRDQLSLGKTYVYNDEGYYTRIAGLPVEDAKQFLINYGNEMTTFDTDVIRCASGAMIFATESQPTKKYSFGGDVYGDIELDSDVVNAIKATSVEKIATDENAPSEYFTIDGVKVNNPAPGNFYILRKGSEVKKIIL